MGWTPPPATASMCQSGSVINHLNPGGVVQTAPERRRSKVKLSGAMPAMKDASASNDVALRCIRWKALLHSPRHGPRHDQVRLIVLTQPEHVFPDRFELPPHVERDFSCVALPHLEPKRSAARQFGSVEARPQEHGPDPLPHGAPVHVEPLEFDRVRPRHPGPLRSDRRRSQQPTTQTTWLQHTR